MAIAAENFPNILSAIEGNSRARKNFESGLRDLNEALEADGVIKSRLKDLKDYFNRAAEVAVEYVNNKFPRDGRTDAEKKLRDDIFINYYLHTSMSALAKIEKSKLSTPYAKALKAVYSEINTLHKIIEPLKGKIVTKQPKGDPVLAYVPPSASEKAKKAVYDALVSVTEKGYEALIEAVLRQKLSIVENFQKRRANEKISPDYYCRSNTGNLIPERAAVIFKVFDRKQHHSDAVLTPKKNYVDLLRKDALQQADYLRNVYIYKNMTKISPILDAKKRLFRSVDVFHRSSDLLDSNLTVEFTDGTRFCASTSIVYSVSVLGTPFTRYPLTFHGVVMPDGKTHAMLSEQQMNTYFLGKAA